MPLSDTVSCSLLPVGRHIRPLRRCAHDASRDRHERREGAQDWWRLRIPTETAV
jgi:hypothetical protein